MTQEIKLTQYSKGGGCGCKIAPAVLQEIVEKNSIGAFNNVIVGNESNDDAAVYKLDDERAIISTTDFFMPIVDDPFDFGRVAAANAISDIYAMGGTPLMAIAILGFPIDKLPTSAAQRILEGGRSICNEAGIPIAGGHTIDSSDPIFGLAVTGTVELQHLKRNNGGKEGDKLFLTKSIGVGILATAIKRGVLNKDHYEPLIHSLTKLNSIGQSLGKIDHVHAMTDVTGFGLIGHLVEMTEGSGLSARINYSAIMKMDHVKEYLQLKTIP
ncbi:MAG TPA: selenide, water dikinase SelD, partial [Chitinophagaceae bacterium]